MQHIIGANRKRKQEQDWELTDQYLTLLHRLHRSVVGLAHIAQTPFPAGGEAAAAAAAAGAGAAATTATSSSASFGAGRASGAAHSGGASGTSEARTNTPPYWP